MPTILDHDKARAAKERITKKRLSEGKTANKMPWEDWESAPKLRNSINLKCIDCMNGPTTDSDLEMTNPIRYVAGVNGSFRNDIRNCLDKRCALHPVRPYRTKEQDHSDLTDC